MLIRLIFAAVLFLQSFGAIAADVRFHNHTPLGLNGFRLSPHNGNAIRVYDPTAATWVTKNLVITSPSVIEGVVSNCYIDDVSGQSMPYNIEHLAFLKMDVSGNMYVNWLPMKNGGGAIINYYDHGPEGFYVDHKTGHGHLIGMAIRKTGREIQGDARSELLITWYNRGGSDFTVIPAGTVAAGAGWVAIGNPIEILVWEDDMPTGTAVLNFTGTAVGASLQGNVEVNGVNNGYSTASTNASPGNPYPGLIKIPFNAGVPGFYSLQLKIQTNAGNVTLGAALNSVFSLSGKF